MRFHIILPEVLLSRHESQIVELEINGKNETLVDWFRTYLGNRFDLFFNNDGSTKGFARIFHNGNMINSLIEIDPNSEGEIEILVAMSGG